MTKWLFCTLSALLVAVGCSDSPVAPQVTPDDLLNAPFYIPIAGVVVSMTPGLHRTQDYPVQLNAHVTVYPHEPAMQPVPEEITISDIWVISEGVFLHEENPGLSRGTYYVEAKLSDDELSRLGGAKVTVAVRVAAPQSEEESLLRSLTVTFPSDL